MIRLIGRTSGAVPIMANPPELWAFVLANIGLFIISSILTLLSYLAYHQSNGQSSYLRATIGFGFIVLGGLVEPAYQLGVRGDYNLDGTELLLLQTGEGILIMFGLGLLFYAITDANSGQASTKDSRSALPDESSYEFDY